METCIILPKLPDTATAEASNSLLGRDANESGRGIKIIWRNTLTLSTPALSFHCSFISCMLLGKGEGSGLSSSEEALGVGRERRQGKEHQWGVVGGLCLCWWLGFFCFFGQLVL